MSQCSDSKKDKIKQANKETREKRKSQRPIVFELKIDYSHLNKLEQETLKMFFVEAKWLYNDILSDDNPLNYDYKNKTIHILNKDKIQEERILKYLPAKNKQDVIYKLRDSIKGLSVLKKKGKRVGKLKFKSEYNSIELSQYNVTHKIVGKNRVKINGIKRPLLVRGLDQLNKYKDLEYANAKLFKKASGYYIKLTTYLNITSNNIPINKKDAIGIDFGIKTSITTSNGEKLNISIGESGHLKKLSRKMNRQVKGSNNRYKTCLKLQKEYERISNKRKDKANKIVHKLLTENQIVCMQDENIKGWHKGWFGKQVQNSALGTIKSKLTLSKQVIVIDRFYPSTKKCYICNNIVNIGLDERVFKCDSCGLVEDRDTKSAKTILFAGLASNNYIPVEYRKLTPMEIRSSALDFQKASSVVEVGSLTPRG